MGYIGYYRVYGYMGIIVLEYYYCTTVTVMRGALFGGAVTTENPLVKG